jgi:hypothetical protein
MEAPRDGDFLAPNDEQFVRNQPQHENGPPSHRSTNGMQMTATNSRKMMLSIMTPPHFRPAGI